MLGSVIVLDSADLELKLLSFRDYQSILYALSAGGQTPIENAESKRAELKLIAARPIVVRYTNAGRNSPE
jgi:hypothetical protein